MPFFASPTAIAQSNYNTGVKGVIADAQSYERSRRREMRILREKQGNSYTPPSSSHSNRPFSISQPLPQQPLFSDLEDASLMAQWRKNRLVELKAAASTSRRQSPSKRHFGRIEYVDAVGYLDAIEKVPKDTVVVVAVYSERSHESSFVLDCLSTVAKRYPTTRFICIHHTEAEMDAGVVPAILAYRGGDIFRSVMNVIKEIPSGRSLSTESLELALLRQHIITKE